MPANPTLTDAVRPQTIASTQLLLSASDMSAVVHFLALSPHVVKPPVGVGEERERVVEVGDVLRRT